MYSLAPSAGRSSGQPAISCYPTRADCPGRHTPSRGPTRHRRDRSKALRRYSPWPSASTPIRWPGTPN